MAFGVGNPLVQQGLLNRVLTHVIVPGFAPLSVTASNMSKSLALLAFNEDAVDQIGTATGLVNSPAPYVLGDLTVNILRSQIVASLYYAQWQANAIIGSVIAYPDSTVLGPFILSNCSILRVDPGAFDGQDPTTKVTIKGIYYLNAAMWAGLP